MCQLPFPIQKSQRGQTSTLSIHLITHLALKKTYHVMFIRSLMGINPLATHLNKKIGSNHDLIIDYQPILCPISISLSRMYHHLTELIAIIKRNPQILNMCKNKLVQIQHHFSLHAFSTKFSNTFPLLNFIQAFNIFHMAVVCSPVEK